MTETVIPIADERVRCDGCGAAFELNELTPGPLDTRWCSACEDTAVAAPAPFDCVHEDDGEP